ncbi:MAG TPA: phytoene/squalene synthase family protein [Verrucomicrobiae bacterium]
MNSSANAEYLLNDLLRDVSRSFYLTLRLLPGAVRHQIGLAYLLARATDTVADTEAISIEKRLATLQLLREQIASAAPVKIDLGEVQARQTSDGEKVLLERINDALALLRELGPDDRQLVQQVLETITSGQELDLQRFGHVSSNNIVSLQSFAELDDYTYRVAGCVGEFWTRICVAHLSPKPMMPLEDLIARGLRFGKGLQLVNILRDFPADLRLGRCYLPREMLDRVSLAPEDLLDPTNEQRLRPTYNELLALGEDHLKTAWAYVLALPRSWVRVRLACALPVLIGVKTLNKLRISNVLNPDTRIKVSRAEVKRIMRETVMFYPLDSVWKNLPSRVLRA